MTLLQRDLPKSCYKKLGILGGMGPAASARFYQEIIFLAQQKYGAVQDTDYPPMVLYSLPLQGFDETGIVDTKKVLFQLQKGIRLLVHAGCEVIVIPCNTVHCFIDELRSCSPVPILSIVEETVKRVYEGGLSSVGLLASATTYALALYEQALSLRQLSCIIPSKEGKDLVTQLIVKAMAGKTGEEETVKNLLEEFEIPSVGGIILGCTELPLVIDQTMTKIPLYSSISILAEAALEYCRKV